VITYSSAAGTFQLRTELTPERDIYTTLQLDPRPEDHRAGSPERLTSHNAAAA
jgi:hypothetical protein